MRACCLEGARARLAYGVPANDMARSNTCAKMFIANLCHITLFYGWPDSHAERGDLAAAKG